MKPHWTLTLDLPGGHRYFTNPTGHIAVADDSGRTPDSTETERARERRRGCARRVHNLQDGVLWLDQTRPVCSSLESGTVPVIVMNGGRRSCVMENPVGALRVAQTFGLRFEPEGKLAEFLALYGFEAVS